MDHIEIVRMEIRMGNDNVVEPHRLRLKKVGDKWLFDLDD